MGAYRTTPIDRCSVYIGLLFNGFSEIESVHTWRKLQRKGFLFARGQEVVQWNPFAHALTAAQGTEFE